MSGSITFQQGPFKGWSLSLFATYHDGELVRVMVQLATPYPYRDGQPESLSGLLVLGPIGFDGWEQASAAELQGGPRRMAELLEWVIEAHRSALDRLTTIPVEQRRHWQAIIDRADESRADFYARYRDGIVPPFEIVGRLSFDVATLAGAR